MIFQVADLPEDYLGQLLQVLLTDEDMVKRTAHTRIAIETVLFKLARVREGLPLTGSFSSWTFWPGRQVRPRPYRPPPLPTAILPRRSAFA